MTEQAQLRDHDDRLRRIEEMLGLETARERGRITTKGKVIENDRGNDSRPLDVATPGTAHPRAELPPFKGVAQLGAELKISNKALENDTWAYHDLCREHEQRLQIVAKALEYFTNSDVSGLDNAIKACDALHRAGIHDRNGARVATLPEGW